MKTEFAFLDTDGKICFKQTEEPTLEEKQAWVQGYIEYAPVAEGAQFLVHCNSEPDNFDMTLGNFSEVIVNEEGLLMNLETNEIASVMACGINGDGMNTQMLRGRAVVKYEYDETKIEDPDIYGVEFMARIAEMLQTPELAIGIEQFTDMKEEAQRERTNDKLRSLFDE
jgi:hypothetical protein